MKIVTWNVAGFRKAKSMGVWDYEEINFDYFANEVMKLDPDVILLQEVLIGKSDQVEEFAKTINYSNWKSVKMSPDHTGTDQWLGLGIISKMPIESSHISILPYPDFPLIFGDGKEAQKFDKMILSATIAGKKFMTTQLQPLHYWGYNYYEEPGYGYAKKVGQEIVEVGSDVYVITGDFQMSHLALPLEIVYKELNLMDALPDKFTRKRQNGKHTKSDHVLVRNSSIVKRSEVVETLTDHFLCFTEID